MSTCALNLGGSPMEIESTRADPSSVGAAPSARSVAATSDSDPRYRYEQEREPLPLGVIDPELAEAVAVARRLRLALGRVAALGGHEVTLPES